MQALNVAGYPSSKIFVIPANMDPAFWQLLGSAATGLRVMADQADLSDTKDPDVAIFLKAMKKYQPSAPLGSFAEQGFADVMTTYGAARTIKGLTPQKLSAYFQTHKHVKVFLGPSLTAAGNAPACFRAWRQPRVLPLQFVRDGVYKRLTKGWIGFGYPPCQ